MPEKRSLQAHAGLTQDAQARAATLRLLRVLAAASLLVPLALFGFASWVSLRDMRALADERISRSLDVMEEQALKGFQSVTVAMDGIQRMLGTRSPTEVAADEPQLHADLVKINRRCLRYNPSGFLGRMGIRRSSRAASPPPTLFYGDQDYFTGPRDHPDLLYVGHIHPSVPVARLISRWTTRVAILKGTSLA